MKNVIFRLVLIIAVLVGYSDAVIAQKNLAKGNAYFDRNMFKEAIPYFEKEMKEGGSSDVREEATEKLADCYRLIGEFEEAEYIYKKLVRRAKKNPNHLLNYALSLKASAKYSEAAEEFKKYARYNPSDQMATVYIESCALAQKWLDENIGKEVRNLSFVNSENSEFSPVLYKDGFIFCSAREGSKKKLISVGSQPNNPSLDFYFVDLQQPYDKLKAVPFDGGKLNSFLHEGPATFTPSGDTIYFTRTVKGERQEGSDVIVKVLNIVMSHRTAEGWSEPVSAFAVNSTKYNVGHPSLSPDGKTLYYMSDMPGGKGATDIYKSELQSDTTWGPAVNLGDDVNTFQHELFPYIYDDHTLYFSSNGHPGMGKLDIFKAIGYGDSWVSVTNVQPPINSIGDDFGFVMHKEFEQSLFSSDRFDSRGLEDIYAYSEVEEVHITVNGGNIEIPNNSVFDGLSFKLIDNETKKETKLTPKGGAYSFTPVIGRDYTIAIRKDGFSFNKIDLNLKRNTKDEFLELDIRSKSKPVAVNGYLLQESQSDSGQAITKPINRVSVQLINSGNTVDLSETNRKGYFSYRTILEEGTDYKLLALRSSKKIELNYSVLGEVSSDGASISGASVALYNGSKKIETVSSNNNGLFSFRSRLSKSEGYTIAVEKDGYSKAAEIIPLSDFKEGTNSVYKIINMKALIVEDKVIAQTNNTSGDSEVLDPPVHLKGSVMNRKNEFLKNAVVTIKQGNKIIAELTTDEEGNYDTYLKKQGDYMVITSYEGYLPNDIKVTALQNRDTLLSLTHILEEITLNKTVRMENIYYDYNKSTVRFESLPTLDVLVEFMLKNPKVKIELASHTDARGNDEYNLKLSQARAKNAAMYLVLEDVEIDRIVYKGYGETKPLIRNAKSEDDHQLNRRTEFKILAK